MTPEELLELVADLKSDTIKSKLEPAKKEALKKKRAEALSKKFEKYQPHYGNYQKQLDVIKREIEKKKDILETLYGLGFPRKGGGKKKKK